MKNKISLMIRALPVIAFALLSACGGGGGDAGSNSVGASVGSKYGSLTLTGTGTTVTGTTFNALSKIASIGTATQWYNNDPPGSSYPYLVLIVSQDSTGVATMVEIVNMTGPNNAFSGQWVALPPTASAIAITGNSVTFNNLLVPGYASASTTTSLTLNGTLNF